MKDEMVLVDTPVRAPGSGHHRGCILAVGILVRCFLRRSRGCRDMERKNNESLVIQRISVTITSRTIL